MKITVGDDILQGMETAIEKTCPQCGVPLNHNSKNQFCSRRCSNKFRGNENKMPLAELVCQQCSTIFTVGYYKRNLKFCSRSCYLMSCKALSMPTEEKRERRRAQQRKNRRNAFLRNPDKFREFDRARGKAPTLSRRFSTLKVAAKRRGLSFSLTKDEFAGLIAMPCHYCQYKLGKPVVNAGGLDRLDNSKGYISGNVVSCCYTCNAMRHVNLTPEETLIAVQAVLAWRQTHPKIENANTLYHPSDDDVCVWKQQFLERTMAEREECKRSGGKFITPGIRYSSAQHSARKRKISFSLSEKEFVELIQHACFYCQFELGTPVQKGSGLDRIDNSKGYESGNVLPCCRTCNLIRGSALTVQETLVAVQAILAYKKQ